MQDDVHNSQRLTLSIISVALNNGGNSSSHCGYFLTKFLSCVGIGALFVELEAASHLSAFCTS